MINNLKIMIYNIKKNIKNAKELKVAFITSVLGMCLNNISFLILWYYFGKTVGTLNGWEPLDIFGLYAFSTTSYGIINSFLYGIYNIPRYITTANFDKYLLTPKNILMKIATSDVSTSAIGDLMFGVICLIVFIVSAHLNIYQILLSLVLILIATIIFFAYSLICSSFSFYFMEGENISLSIYQTFLSTSIYHGGAFTGILRKVFIYIMPALLVGAVPVEIVKNINLTKVLGIILLTMMWLYISIKFFYRSLKKYESNNFFGFGK